jgi:hypothetical protein
MRGVWGRDYGFPAFAISGESAILYSHESLCIALSCFCSLSHGIEAEIPEHDVK